MGSHTRPAAARLSAPTIERATSADLPEVVAMERECYSDPWPASAFAVLPDNPRVYFAVARGLRGRVIGYVVGWYVIDEGELANLAVAPDDRRSGTGRALLDAMIADAMARGTKELYLEVRESNAAARRLYHSLEFEEVGRRKAYYRSPTEDALILRKTFVR
jgi:[ribosomal protein S18]-alanine N-acetyltransferase